MPRHFMEEEKAIARIVIGELDSQVVGNIIKPIRKCCVITTAGQIWDVWVDAFCASKTNLTNLWNEHRKLFIKRDQS